MDIIPLTYDDGRGVRDNRVPRVSISGSFGVVPWIQQWSTLDRLQDPESNEVLDPTIFKCHLSTGLHCLFLQWGRGENCLMQYPYFTYRPPSRPPHLFFQQFFTDPWTYTFLVFTCTKSFESNTEVLLLSQPHPTDFESIGLSKYPVDDSGSCRTECLHFRWLINTVQCRKNLRRSVEGSSCYSKLQLTEGFGPLMYVQ